MKCLGKQAAIGGMIVQLVLELLRRIVHLFAGEQRTPRLFRERVSPTVPKEAPEETDVPQTGGTPGKQDISRRPPPITALIDHAPSAPIGEGSIGTMTVCAG